MREQQIWLPEWQYDLATTWMHHAHFVGNSYFKAQEAHQAAINICKDLRDWCARENQIWLPEWQAGLAEIHIGYAYFLNDQGQVSAAMEAYQEAITVLTALRDWCAREQQPWLSDWLNHLEGAQVSYDVLLNN